MIEVNGVKYNKKEVKRVKPIASKMALLFALMYGGGNTRAPDREPSIDIVKEYGLIQLKKSSLSAKQRKQVVQQFEQLYEKAY